MSQDQPDIQDSNKDDIEEATKKRTPKSFKPTKIIGFPQRRVELVFYDEDNRPSGTIQIKKTKKEVMGIKLQPKKKRNPDREVLSSVGRYPLASQVYTYKNNPAYIYIHHGTDYIRLNIEDFYLHLAEILGSIIQDKDKLDKLISASLSLQLGQVNRPFIKIGLDKIKGYDLEKEILSYVQQQEQKRKELGK